MKLFRTGSPAVVKECEINFGFLPLKYQLCIRKARFLQKYLASENTLCLLFACTARRQLIDIFEEFCDSITTACQLSNLIWDHRAIL